MGSCKLQFDLILQLLLEAGPGLFVRVLPEVWEKISPFFLKKRTSAVSVDSHFHTG